MERKTPRTKGAKMGSTAIALVLSAMTIHLGTPVIPAQASISPQESSGLARNYQIPAGSMDTALNAFADRSGLHVVFDAKLTERLNAPELSGVYSIEEGLDQLLRGTGLSYRLSENGRAVSIILAQANNGTMNDAGAPGAEALPPIDIGVNQTGAAGPAAASEPAPTSALGSDPGGRITGYSATNATTALKMDAPIMQTPESVQVVTRQTMDDQQAVSVKDAITTNVSGVQIAPGFVEGYKIRGFTNYGNSYKDGLFEYRMENLDTTNLQSIEVLKGPAAMLYGRAEPGGIVDLIVKRPLETPYYSVQEQAGTFGYTRTTVDATGPVTQDKQLLYRFNGEFFHNGTYEDFVKDQNYFFAPTFTWRPSERFRANVDVELQRYIFVGDFASLPAIGAYPAPIPISRYLGLPQTATTDPRDYVKRRFAYDWTYDFDNNWSLTNWASYSMFWMGGLSSYTTSINQATGALGLGETNYSAAGAFHDYDFTTNIDLKGKFDTGPLTHSTLLGFDHMSEHEPLFGSISAAQRPLDIYYPVLQLCLADQCLQ